MTRAGRITRLEAAMPRRPVAPVFNLDALTEDEVRFIMALQEKSSQGKDTAALTEDEVQALIALDKKARIK